MFEHDVHANGQRNPLPALLPGVNTLSFVGTAAVQMSSHSSSRMSDSCDQHSSISQQEQHWDSADEEVTSCCVHEVQFQQQLRLAPLHRVKRVWDHLCMLKGAEDDIYAH
jgi:hypothetical protein